MNQRQPKTARDRGEPLGRSRIRCAPDDHQTEIGYHNLGQDTGTHRISTGRMCAVAASGKSVVVNWRCHFYTTCLSRRMHRLILSLSGLMLISTHGFAQAGRAELFGTIQDPTGLPVPKADRKSTRLNSSHLGIKYAVFCLKKKKKTNIVYIQLQLSYLNRLSGIYTTQL